MILGYNDLAERWNVKPSKLRQWKRRGILPEPDTKLGVSPGWTEATITRWEADNKGRHNGTIGSGG